MTNILSKARSEVQLSPFLGGPFYDEFLLHTKTLHEATDEMLELLRKEEADWREREGPKSPKTDKLMLVSACLCIFVLSGQWSNWRDVANVINLGLKAAGRHTIERDTLRIGTNYFRSKHRKIWIQMQGGAKMFHTVRAISHERLGISR
jgi:hypothetical protein